MMCNCRRTCEIILPHSLYAIVNYDYYQGIRQLGSGYNDS